LKSNHVGNPDRQSLPFGLVLRWPLRASTSGFRRFARPIFDWFTQSAEAPHQSGSFMAHAVGKKTLIFLAFEARPVFKFGRSARTSIPPLMCLSRQMSCGGGDWS
jgi:hypothetical protein